MKKLFVICFVTALAASLSITAFAAPVCENPNWTACQNNDFSDTLVEVTAPVEIFVGDDAGINVDVTNLADRGLPQVTIFVNGDVAAYYSQIGKGATQQYVIEVDTTEAGEQTFEIEVWTRLGNKNYEDLLYADTVTVDVQSVDVDWFAAFTDALADAIADGSFAVLSCGNNNTCVSLFVDGVEYVFVGGNGYNSSKSLVAEDGVRYAINITGNGRITLVRG